LIRLALRNLARNRWRSGLTVAGVAVAVAALAWSQTMLEAFIDTMIKSVAAVQMGDLRIESEAHAKDSSVFDAFPATGALLERVRRVPGVRAATPRLLSFGLLGREGRSQAAMVIGVDPEAEEAASEVARSLVAGAWLSRGPAQGPGGREVVLGENLAKLLSARLGDELVVMLQAADGSMGDERLRVVGLARTGTSELDLRAAWMRLGDVGWLTALDGQAHELMVRIERGAPLDRVAEAVRAAVAGLEGPKLAVRTWEELAPDMRQLVDLTQTTTNLLYGIVYFVAALGILNVQRMAALERRRELAVMMAVGMTPARLASLVVLEAALLTGVGVVAGALLGWGLSAWHAYAGLDLAALGSEGFSYGGAAIASRLYCVVRPALIAGPALAVLAVGALCGAWPALASARLELVRAISGRS
jgi:ABC-type lipoprotein release transport system permease subunit